MKENYVHKKGEISLSVLVLSGIKQENIFYVLKVKFHASVSKKVNDLSGFKTLL